MAESVSDKTTQFVEDMWAKHRQEESLLDLAEMLWGNHQTEILETKDLQTYVKDILAPRELTKRAVESITHILANELRTQAPPADDMRDRSKPRWLM